jgi:hypothetical protein
MPRLVLAAALLCAAPAAPAQTSHDTSFGLFPFLVGNMDSQIGKVVADARANDLDTIYVSVYRATGPTQGTLYVTDTAGRWQSSWGPVRPGGAGIHLANLIAAAHQQNLQVVGVLKCFDATVQPTHAAHRAYLLDVIGYLLDSYDAAGRPVYDLDGLALDYIRYVGSSTGNDPKPVTDLVAEIKRRCGALSLHAYLLAGRYTFDGPSYDGNFNSYASVLASNSSQYGQHWEQLAPHLDALMPMAYTADGNIYRSYALHLAYCRTVASYCRQACQRAGVGTRRVVNTIRTYSDSSETATAATIEASIAGTLAGGGDGYQAFRYGTLSPHADWWAKLKQYAVPGPNRPIPSFAGVPAGLDVTLDASASRDFDEPTAALRVRYDFDGDGRFDTPWSGATQPVRLTAATPASPRVGMQVADANGLIGATTRRIRIPDVFAANPPAISAGFGAQVKLTIDVGAGSAGRSFIVAATLSGTSPGIQLAPGLVLPIVYDGLTAGMLQLANTPILQNGIGTLDANGRAIATFAVPPGLLSFLSGRTIHWAAAGADASGFRLATNATPLLILP